MVADGAPSPVAGMVLSAAGLRMIGNFEGYRRFPYNDPVGYATIGYGHLLHYSAVNALDRARYPLGLSVPAALRLLDQDCLPAQRAVQLYVTRPLGQAQFDALCSFAFNCGAGALRVSSLLATVNRQPGPAGAATIAADFILWDHAGGVELPGLRARRLAESQLFLQGVYPS